MGSRQYRELVGLEKPPALPSPAVKRDKLELLTTHIQGQGALQTPSHHLRWVSIIPSINSNKEGLENSTRTLLEIKQAINTSFPVE